VKAEGGSDVGSTPLQRHSMPGACTRSVESPWPSYKWCLRASVPPREPLGISHRPAYLVWQAVEIPRPWSWHDVGLPLRPLRTLCEKKSRKRKV